MNFLKQWFHKQYTRRLIERTIYKNVFEIQLFKKEISDQQRTLWEKQRQETLSAGELHNFDECHQGQLHKPEVQQKRNAIKSKMSALAKELKEIPEAIEGYFADIKLRQAEVDRFKNQLKVLKEFKI